MLNITYTISPRLINELKSIASVRQSILLLPLSLKSELDLQFEFQVDRIYNSLILSGLSANKKEISAVLINYVSYVTQVRRKNSSVSKVDQFIYGYKQAMDLLRQYWLVSPRKVDLDTIIKIHNVMFHDKLKIQEKRLTEVLDYMQTASENPVIQAGIAKLAFMALAPFNEGNELTSTLYSYLFLYKAGLDFNSMLVLEEGWATDSKEFFGQYGKATSSTNVTSWLEYYSRMMARSLDQSYRKMLLSVKNVDQQGNSKLATELNDRQRSILALFEDPNYSVTNRIVQKLFKVSQITASRDLAKLASLGLLFVYGKGRSIRYTKI